MQAARDAGIEKLTLVEEPAGAAFYSLDRQSPGPVAEEPVRWTARAGSFTLRRRRWHQRLHADPSESPRRSRVSSLARRSGKHLLLGGDNLDLTLAWLVESKLSHPAIASANAADFGANVRRPKGKLLADPNLKSVEITVLGAGSSLVGGTLKTEITREEALETDARRFPAFLRNRRETRRGKTKSLPGIGTSLCFRSRGDLASGGISGTPTTMPSRTRFYSTADFSFLTFASSASRM